MFDGDGDVALADSDREMYPAYFRSSLLAVVLFLLSHFGNDRPQASVHILFAGNRI